MYAYLDTALYYAKAAAGFVSAIAVALLTIYGPETDIGHTLTIVVAVAGAVAVYAVPNRKPAGDELIDPDGLYDDDVDPLEDDHGPVDDLAEPGEHKRQD